MEGDNVDLGESLYYAAANLISEGRTRCQIAATDTMGPGYSIKAFSVSCGRKTLTLTAHRIKEIRTEGVELQETLK
jgi:hypothetical protein